MADLTGKRLGKYELVERLGRGGMAEVYKAYQPGMDRFVAIKVMHSHLAESEDFVTRFKREAQLVGQLRHPHIVQVIDFDVQNEGYYMVMEHIKGETLKYYIQQKGELTGDESLRIMALLADALHYAHQEGMIHRDIKPANVMFTDKTYTHPVLTDFGIARIISGGTQLTASGAFVGTPAYISPEIARGEQADERSDIYSMGIVLYEMLTGKVPYDADTPFAVIMKHVNEPLPSPRQFNINVTDTIERVLFTALAKSPNERYQTSADFRDALNEARGVIAFESPTVSGANRGTELQEKATSTFGAGSADDLATFVTDGGQIASAGSPTMMGGRSQRSNMPRILAGVAALIVILGLAYVFVFNDDVGDNPQVTNNTDVPAITLTPSETPAPQVADVGDYDNTLVEQGQFGRAISNHTQAILQDSDNPLHYIRRGDAYAALYLAEGDESNQAKAYADFEAALSLDPTDPNYNFAYLVRGQFYADQGEYELALADFDTAIELDATSASLYAQRGMVHYRQGNQEEANVDFSLANSLDDSNGLAYLGQALVASENGDFGSAIFNINLAIETDPEFAEAYAVRGEINQQIGSDNEAKADFDTAIDLNNRLTRAYIGRGIYYENVENTRLALRDYSTALSQRPNADIFLRRAQIYMSQEDTELAEADFEAALELDATLIEAQLGYAQIQEDEGDSEDAIAAYSQAIELDETLLDARVSRGWLYFDLEDYASAEADFAYVLAQDDENEDANLGLGDIAVENDEFGKAITFYNMVIDENDEFAPAYFGRGLANSELGNHGEALNDFNSAIEYEYEPLYETYFERGLAQQELGNIEEAVLDFTEAIDNNGEYAPAHFYRGIASYNAGNIEDALADFNRAGELGMDDEAGDLLQFRGIALSLAGEYDAAIDDFDTVLADDPDNLEALYYRALSYSGREDYNEAIDDFTTLLATNYDELGQAYLQRGIAYKESGDNDKAISDFDRAIDQGDDAGSVAYLQRGIIYYFRDQLGDAESDFTSAINLNETLPDAYYYRGNVYYEQAEYEQALDDLILAIDYNYDPLEHAYLTRGVVYSFLDDEEEAIRDYTEAIRLNSEYGLAYYNRGLAYENLDDYARAIDNFTLAIENDYFNPSRAHYRRGLNYEELEEYADARDDFTVVIDFGEENVAEAYYERARMHLFLTNYQDAIDDNTTLLDLEYEFPEFVFNNRGATYLEMADYENAIADFSAAIQIDETYALAYKNRAEARRLVGEYETAIEDYQLAVELGYSNEYAIAYGLGNSYYTLEDYESALPQFNIALNIDPEDTEILLLRARTHVQLDNVGAAFGDYEDLTFLDISNVEAFYERALLFMGEGNWDDAIADLEHTLLLNPSFSEAYYQQGLIYIELGAPTTALTRLTHAIELNPELGDAYRLLGDLYFEQGDLQSALTNYDQYAEIKGDDANTRVVLRIAQLESALGDEARATPVPSTTGDDGAVTETAERVPYGPAVVLSTDPSTAIVQVSIVRGIAVNTSTAQALAELDAIIADQGENVPYLALRAELNIRLGNGDDAVADANRAIELGPEHPSGYLVLAVYNATFEYDEEAATELAQLALAFASNNGTVALVYADIQSEFGNFGQAIELYGRAEILGAPIVNVLIARSTAYYAVGDYENAIADRERLLELNEFDPLLSLELAGTYILNGQYAEAEAIVQPRIARWGADDVSYFAHAAYVAYRNGNYDLAREWAGNTLAIYDEPAATYVLALIDAAEGNYDDALAKFEALRDYDYWSYAGYFLNPRYGHDLNFDTAQVYRLQGDDNVALQLLDEFIAQEPSSGMAYLGKAEILLAQDNLYAAQWNFLYVFSSTYDFDVTQLVRERALEQGADFTFDLAFQLLNRDDSEAAWVLIEPALARFPDAQEFRWLQGRYLIQQGELEGARILGETLQVEDELSPYGYLILGDLAIFNDNSTDYLVLTEQAFSRTPEQPYVAFEHARAMRVTNQVAVALNIYRTAEVNGINPGVLHFERGMFYAELMRYEEARDDLAALAENAGVYTPSDAVLTLISMYLQFGQLDEVHTTTAKFAEIKLAEWEAPDYYANLAFAAYKIDDVDLANDLVARAMGLQDDNATARYVSALLRAQAGDYAEASTIFADLDETTDIYQYGDPFINITFGHIIWFDWANAEVAQENYDMALELYTRAIDETYEEWFVPYLSRAEAHIALVDIDSARADLEYALTLIEDEAITAQIETRLGELDSLEATPESEPVEEEA